MKQWDLCGTLIDCVYYILQSTLDYKARLAADAELSAHRVVNMETVRVPEVDFASFSNFSRLMTRVQFGLSGEQRGTSGANWC